MNFYQRMGILLLKKRVNRDKCSFTTKHRIFGVFAIDEILRYRWTRFVGSRTLCHPVVPYKANIDRTKMTWTYVRLGFEAKIDEKGHGLPPKANEKWFIIHLSPFIFPLIFYLSPISLFILLLTFISCTWVFFIFSSTSFQALSWVIFYLSLESFFIFLLSSFLSFFLIFFIFHLIFFIFHLRPGKVRAPALPPSTAVVTPLRSRCWWSRYHFTLTLFKMIVVRGSWRLTWSGSPPQFTFVSEQVGWGGPWLGVTWSSRDLGRCPAVLRADVRIECNFDFGGL